MAQETVDSTMVDSTAIEALPLDNPVTQTIMARRSIRKYLDKPVEHEKLAYLVECGINAPSGSIWSSVASTPPVAVTVSLGFCAW